MGMIKRIIPSVAIILVVCIVAGIGAVKEATRRTDAAVTESFKIIIDPGHAELPNTTD